MARFTNSNTETYRNVDIDSTYWNDGSFEITINSVDDILEFDSIQDAKAYIDTEYLKYPYIDLAVDIYNYQYYVHPFEGIDMNIFDIAKDLNDINQAKSYIEWIVDDISEMEWQPYLDMANDILPKLYAIREYVEKPSYTTSEGLTAALIGRKIFSDFEPTSDGLIDIYEYLAKVIFIHGNEYKATHGYVPNFYDVMNAWEYDLDWGFDCEKTFEDLYITANEIDF